MKAEIPIKTEHYQNIVTRRKNHLFFRKNTRYGIGDVLILKELDKGFTGWETHRKIINVQSSGPDIPEGFISFKLENCLETPFDAKPAPVVN